MVPIYTGGQIPAVQGAASASLRQAEAELRTTSQSLIVQLVQAYFGQQLAERALAVRTDVRDGLQRHVDDAEALERGASRPRPSDSRPWWPVIGPSVSTRERSTTWTRPARSWRTCCTATSTSDDHEPVRHHHAPRDG